MRFRRLAILLLVLLLGIVGMTNLANAELSQSVEFNGSTYTLTITKFVCSNRGGTGCYQEISDYTLHSYSMKSDDGSKIAIYLKVTGVCATCGEREYNAQASATRASSTDTSASSAWDGKLAKVYFTIDVAPHTHSWQPDGEGAHSCANGCGQVNVACDFGSDTPACNHEVECLVCHGKMKDPAKHTGELEWTETATTHKQAWSCCKATTVDEEPHEWEKGVCSECGYVCQHGSTEIRNAVTATCTALGYTGDTYCTVCGEMLTLGTDIAKLTHSFVNYISNNDASCLEDGTETALCDNKCGATDTRIAVGSALGHWEVIFPEIAPSCTMSGGTEMTYCYRCRVVLSAKEIIPPLEHIPQAVTGYAPNCLEEGMTDGVICTICGAALDGCEVIPALGHSRQIVPGYAPTCAQEGLTDGEECALCKAIFVRQEAIPAMDHTPVKTQGKKPSCTSDGYTEGISCGVCGVALEGVEILPAHGHLEVEVLGKPATCTRDGRGKGVYCRRCEKYIVEQEVIPAGHDYEITEVASTCTRSGWTQYECTRCGVSHRENLKPATGHDLEEMTTADGWHIIHCTKCYFSYSKR